MSVVERFSDLTYRFYGAIRHRGSWDLAEGSVGASDFGHLAGHKYALLITYREDGSGVPTPVWFGLADGKVYVHTERRTAKVKRIEANPRVRLAPCTMRAKPKGPAAEGRARVLPEGEEARAEDVIQDNYGFARKVYEAPLEGSSLDFIYLEIAPAGGGGS